jgi:hypothetical protein
LPTIQETEVEGEIPPGPPFKGGGKESFPLFKGGLRGILPSKRKIPPRVSLRKWLEFGYIDYLSIEEWLT